MKPDPIITLRVKPPISDFRWDWCAYRVSRVEDIHSYGWGTTEAEAIEDLMRLEQELAECLEEYLDDLLHGEK